MEKATFKIGDVIVPKEYHKGIEKATVSKVDDKNYYLKILNGTAIIPITSQTNYKLESNE